MKRIATVSVVVLGMLLSGCSRKLDKDTAEKILLEKVIKDGFTECTWTAPMKRPSNEWTFFDFDANRDCASNLAKAGLIKTGNCFDTWTNSCNRFVSAAGSAKLDAQADSLIFACGQVKFLGVTSITTEDNKATVKYQREVTLDKELLSKLPGCKLNEAEDGKAERERNFVRDDDGKWFIK